MKTVRERARKFADSLDNGNSRWWSPKGLLLFILPLPLLPAMLISLAKGDFSQTLVHLSAVTLYISGAILARRGLLNEMHYRENRFAVTPFPLKTLAAVLIAIATGLSAWLAVHHTALFSVTMVALTFLAFYLSYGLEPKRKNFFSGNPSGLENDAFISLLNEAQIKIEKIFRAAGKVDNVELNLRLQRITDLARQVIASLEKNPKDLAKARKFLVVYLDGAQKVSEGYAQTHAQANSKALEEKFRNVLVTIEDVFIQQQKRLLENDILDLDVQIEVLDQQMKQEGIR